MKGQTRYTQPRRTRAQWSALIERHAHSGLSVKQFCAREALVYGSFIKWRSLLKDQTQSGHGGGFVELTAETIKAAVSEPRGEACCIELRVGSAVTLRIYADQ